jgi:hypothetical protein
MAVRKLLEGRRIDRRLKLRELQVLAAVVECGSMVKAAGQLGMSQPAVSAAIANLEGALGVRLEARGVLSQQSIPRRCLSVDAWRSTNCARD